MDLEFDLPQRIGSAIAAVKRERPRQLLKLSADMIAQVKVRVQDTGGKPKAGRYGPYTKRYAKDRAAKGYQTAYVDFTRTGAMWASVRPFLKANEAYSGTVLIKPADATSQAKLNGQKRKYGNILEPSATEVAAARKARAQDVVKLVQDALDRGV